MKVLKLGKGTTLPVSKKGIFIILKGKIKVTPLWDARKEMGQDEIDY